MRRIIYTIVFGSPSSTTKIFVLLRGSYTFLEDFISGPRIGERLLITDRQQQTALDGGNLWMCWLFLSAVCIYPCLSLSTPEVTSRFFWERIKNDEVRNEMTYFFPIFVSLISLFLFEFDL